MSTSEVLERIGRDMDRIAAETPLGPWREPIKRDFRTPDQITAAIVERISEMNARAA